MTIHWPVILALYAALQEPPLRKLVDVASSYNIKHIESLDAGKCSTIDYDNNTIFVSKACKKEERRQAFVAEINHAYDSLGVMEYTKPEPVVIMKSGDVLDVLMTHDIEHTYYSPVNGATSGGLIRISDGWVFNGVKQARIPDGRKSICVHELLHALEQTNKLDFESHEELGSVSSEIFRKLYLE